MKDENDDAQDGNEKKDEGNKAGNTTEMVRRWNNRWKRNGIGTLELNRWKNVL